MEQDKPKPRKCPKCGTPVEVDKLAMPNRCLDRECGLKQKEPTDG